LLVLAGRARDVMFGSSTYSSFENSVVVIAKVRAV
jgi:hypothetical protein